MREATEARLLTDQEIEQMRINWMVSQKRRKEEECEATGGHDRVATRDTPRGWHEGHCSKCGKDLSYDSSG